MVINIYLYLEIEAVSQLGKSRNDSKRPILNYYFDPVIENRLLTQSQFMDAKIKIHERQKEQMRRQAQLEVSCEFRFKIDPK